MNLNVSTGVGFAALFGVSLMDGVLMVKAITTLRQQGANLDEAIIDGAESRIRPILMTALVAMLGLLPASLATGLGSDVQRPLATVIVWGLFSAMILTLFLLPVFYRIFVPGLPASEVTIRTEVGEFMEPLPDVGVPDIIALLDYLRLHHGEADVFRIAGDMQREFAGVVSTVKAAEMLGFVETPGQSAVLTQTGQRFLAATPDERQQIWRAQILKLGVFLEILDVLQRQPEKAVEKDYILEMIVLRMPYENYENVFNTVIRWARFGNLFSYDATGQRVELNKTA
jgi:cobalt-zinc-cadmium resistance protein CzcA